MGSVRVAEASFDARHYNFAVRALCQLGGCTVVPDVVLESMADPAKKFDLYDCKQLQAVRGPSRRTRGPQQRQALAGPWQPR